MYKGLNKLKPPSGGAKPIDMSILQQFFNVLDDTKYDNCVWRAIYSFAHEAIKRPDEYTTQKPTVSQLAWNGVDHVLPKDAKYCIFYYTKSKTNTLKNVEFSILLCKCPAICAVHEIFRILYVRKHTESDCIFTFADRKVLSYNTLRNKTRDLCKELHLDHTSLTPHGLRKGGAQAQARQGIAPSVTMAQAGWKSFQTYLLYIQNMPVQDQINSMLKWLSVSKHR